MSDMIAEEKVCPEFYAVVLNWSTAQKIKSTNYFLNGLAAEVRVRDNY